MKKISIVFLVLLIASLVGCKKDVSKTVYYGDDGVTVSHEVYNVEEGELADIKLGEAVIACQDRIKTVESSRWNKITDPQDIALLTAIDGLVKNQPGYQDPCAVIKTHIHEEIAESEMWARFWDGAWDFGKTGLVSGFTYLGADSLFSALGSSGASYIFDSGGGDLAITDSLKSAVFGNIDSSYLGSILSDAGEVSTSESVELLTESLFESSTN